MSGQGIDLQTITLTATGFAVNARCRWRGLYYRSGALAGNIILRDGGPAGSILINVPIPGASGVSNTLQVIGEGVKFFTNMYVEVPTNTSVLIFYDLVS